MVKVLFVCLGNICRSPMAEAVFQHLVNEKGLGDQILVDSAGTGNYHIGSEPHEGTIQKLTDVGIQSNGLVARQVKEDDFVHFNYVVVMDDENLGAIQHLVPDQTDIVVKKLLDYIPDTKVHNVPDPFFTGDFDETYELISSACQHLFNEVKLKIDSTQEG